MMGNDRKIKVKKVQYQKHPVLYNIILTEEDRGSVKTEITGLTETEAKDLKEQLIVAGI